jgi:hypothetical protein
MKKSNRTKEQQRKLRENRRRLRLNKKKKSELVQKMNKTIINREEIDYTKWYNVGKDVLSQNYHGLVSDYIKDTNLNGEYNNKTKDQTLSELNGDMSKGLLFKFTNMFLYGSLVGVTENDSIIKHKIQDPNLKKNESIVSWNIEVESQLNKMSKRKQKVIIDGLLKQHLNLKTLMKDLKECVDKNKVMEFRTQSIHPTKTNMFSCFDDFTYGFLEWLYEERELIQKCVTPVLFSIMVKDCWMRLGNPNNRIEVKNNTLEKLLKYIEEDKYRLSFFRMDEYGYLQNDDLVEYESHKVIDSWIKSNPKLKHWFQYSERFGMKELLITKSEYLYNSTDTLTQQPSGSSLYDIKKDGMVTPEFDVTWLMDKKDDEMVTIYRSVSDKNYPVGWSWTFDKSLSVTWIRSRGLVDDFGKTKSYIVETQIPKKDILMVHSRSNSKDSDNIYNYNEVVVRKEKLKDCELIITEIDGSNPKQIYDVIMGDTEIKESLLHQDLSGMIEMFKEWITELESPYQKVKNEKWFIRKCFLDWSNLLTEKSLNKKFNQFTQEFEFPKQLESV